MTIPEACELVLQAGAMGDEAKFMFLIWENLGRERDDMTVGHKSAVVKVFQTPHP